VYTVGCSKLNKEAPLAGYGRNGAAVLVVSILSLVLGACNAETPASVEPVAQPVGALEPPLPPTIPWPAPLTADSLRRIGSTEDLYAFIAGRVPSFAGMYFASNGHPAVMVTNLSDFEAAKFQIVPVAEGKRVQGQVAAVYTSVQAKYTFLQLRMFRNAARHNLASLQDVVHLALDFPANRIEVGVATERAQTAAGGYLASLGIPEDARSVIVTSRIQPQF
jgi:hypothetical protein